jgi:DNA-binding transcriptional ArsR family regulator
MSATDASDAEVRPDAELHEALTLDRVIHEPARLAILAVLSGTEEVDFAFLLAATGMTKGNLSRQAGKLEEAGYITIRKYFRGKIPATGYRITDVGRAALARYGAQIAALSQQIQAPPDKNETGDRTHSVKGGT